ASGSRRGVRRRRLVLPAPTPLLVEVIERDFVCSARVRCWPIAEVATRLVEVRSVRHSGLDLLTLSSSHLDPKQTLGDCVNWVPSLPCGLWPTVAAHRPR